jgi:hypothetical protein
LLDLDVENTWHELDRVEDKHAMPQILGRPISYRIAIGPQHSRKAFMIRTILPLNRPDPGLEQVAISLHAGVSCGGQQKEKRERLCRYIARPAAVISPPLFFSLSSTDQVVYTLKKSYPGEIALLGHGISTSEVTNSLAF